MTENENNSSSNNNTKIEPIILPPTPSPLPPDTNSIKKDENK